MSQLTEATTSRNNLCKYIGDAHQAFVDLFHCDGEKKSLETEYHRIAKSKPPSWDKYVPPIPNYPNRPSIGWKIVWIIWLIFGCIDIIPGFFVFILRIFGDSTAGNPNLQTIEMFGLLCLLPIVFLPPLVLYLRIEMKWKKRIYTHR